MAIGNYRVSLKIVSFFRDVTMDMFSFQGTFNACIHNVTCCIRQNSILYRSMDLRDQSSEVNNSSRYPRKHEIISLSLSLYPCTGIDKNYKNDANGWAFTSRKRLLTLHLPKLRKSKQTNKSNVLNLDALI